jgi:hypothetical protein
MFSIVPQVGTVTSNEFCQFSLFVRSGDTYTRGFAMSFHVDSVTGLLFTEQVILKVPAWASIDDAMIERLDGEARPGVVMQKTMGALH